MHVYFEDYHAPPIDFILIFFPPQINRESPKYWREKEGQPYFYLVPFLRSFDSSLSGGGSSAEMVSRGFPSTGIHPPRCWKWRMELRFRGVKDFGSEVCGSLKWVLMPDKLMIYANPPHGFFQAWLAPREKDGAIIPPPPKIRGHCTERRSGPIKSWPQMSWFWCLELQQPQGHLVLLLIYCMTLFKLISFLLILQLWATWAIFFSTFFFPPSKKSKLCSFLISYIFLNLSDSQVVPWVCSQWKFSEPVVFGTGSVSAPWEATHKLIYRMINLDLSLKPRNKKLGWFKLGR